MPGIMLFQNFMAADRKRNLARFHLFANNQDTGWIDDAPSEPLTEISAIFNPVMVIDVSTADVITLVLTADVTNTTLNYNSGLPSTGTVVTLRIVQDNVGGHQFAFPSNLRVDQAFYVDPGADRATYLNIIYQTDHWEFLSAPFSTPVV